MPNTTAAGAKYFFNGRETTSSTLEPPFNDTYEWVATYTVEPGFHWIQVGKSWSDGPFPNTCADLNARNRNIFTGPATVELTIAVD